MATFTDTRTFGQDWSEVTWTEYLLLQMANAVKFRVAFAEADTDLGADDGHLFTDGIFTSADFPAPPSGGSCFVKSADPGRDAVLTITAW